ncbi:zinc finger A20 and AN1 domain-containing stress-associated protein 5-like [Andrographis paniculata]|uniref:zinc finger A20 and AN1 domain-containing stress-associated protein 5-like n=1 Tax=Andrographis paniculata TaxID=175694 RepID=UPI0021E8EA7E|nr:zinc finger A20 and AN1 domain-containing stress-associated protein 5-like [Andrographis paniculata]
MAKNSRKEETELKVSGNLPLCTPPQTITAPPPQILASRLPESSDLPVSEACDRSADSGGGPETPDLAVPVGGRKRPREVARCAGSNCRKRIGLIGFRCRCGEVFCSEHRYSDRHNCGYDYKSAGREAIARENPVVRAAKLLKV